MAWTSPRTWVAGEKVTATLMNVHVRDNLAALRANVGVLYQNGAAVGSVTTGETDLATFSVPGGTLAANGQRLVLRATGHFPANGNNKTFKSYFAGTNLHSFLTTANGASWDYVLEVTRRGATSVVERSHLRIGGNTTYNTATAVADAAINATIWDSHTPTLSGACIIKFTGTAPTANNDIVCDSAQVEMSQA